MAYCYNCYLLSQNPYKLSMGQCSICYKFNTAMRRCRESLPCGGKTSKELEEKTVHHYGFLCILETDAQRYILRMNERIDPMEYKVARSKIFNDGSRIPVPVDLTAFRVVDFPSRTGDEED